jgi:hypothetical protein
MPQVEDFYSVIENRRRPDNRVHHNNDLCSEGRYIPSHERAPGNGGYPLCVNCKKLNDFGR